MVCLSKYLSRIRAWTCCAIPYHLVVMVTGLKIIDSQLLFVCYVVGLLIFQSLLIGDGQSRSFMIVKLSTYFNSLIESCLRELFMAGVRRFDTGMFRNRLIRRPESMGIKLCVASYTTLLEAFYLNRGGILLIILVTLLASLRAAI